MFAAWHRVNSLYVSAIGTIVLEFATLPASVTTLIAPHLSLHGFLSFSLRWWAPQAPSSIVSLYLHSLLAGVHQLWFLFWRFPDWLLSGPLGTSSRVFIYHQFKCNPCSPWLHLLLLTPSFHLQASVSSQPLLLRQEAQLWWMWAVPAAPDTALFPPAMGEVRLRAQLSSSLGVVLDGREIPGPRSCLSPRGSLHPVTGQCGSIKLWPLCSNLSRLWRAVSAPHWTTCMAAQLLPLPRAAAFTLP